MRPQEHATVQMQHGLDLVTEYCIEAHPRTELAAEWVFVIMTQRRYGEGDECWLTNSRNERLGARVVAVSRIGEFYRVTIGMVIPPGWETA